MSAVASHTTPGFSQAILDALPAHLAVIAPDGTILATNAAWVKFAASNGGESPHYLGSNYLHECDRAVGAGDPQAARILEGVRKVQDGITPSFEAELACHAPSEERWFLMRVASLGDGSGAILVSYEDITERTRAELALQDSELRFRTLFEQAPVAISISRGGIAVYVNPRLVQLFGLERREEFVGHPVAEFFTPEEGAASKERTRQRALGLPAPTEYESVLVRPDGTEFPAHIAVSVVELQDGPAFIAFVTDITERKQREREMVGLISVSAALRASHTLCDVAPTVLEQVRELVGAQGAVVAMRDLDTGQMMVECAAGIFEPVNGQRLIDGEGMLTAVIASEEERVGAARELVGGGFDVEELGAGTVVCVPLLLREHAIGAMAVGRASGFSETDKRILHAIGEVAANALHRRGLHERSEMQVRRLRALHEIDTAISAALDLRVTLGLLLDYVTSQLQVDAAHILRLQPLTRVLEPIADRGFRTRSSSHRTLTQDEEAGWIAMFQRHNVIATDLHHFAAKSKWASTIASESFVFSCSLPLIAKGHVKGVLEVFHRSPFSLDNGCGEYLEALANQAAIAIDSAELVERLQASNNELTLAYDATIEGWSRALELRDSITQGHSQRVTEVTLELAMAMDVPTDELVHIRRGALLHDIGKMGIPDTILLKPGPLTAEEWVIMQKHPVFAYELLQPIRFLRHALDIPYCHHEKWDGSGYPRGLKGEDIPLAARIFAVVDAWDALRSDRPYRPACSVDFVRSLILAGSGSHFDPTIVEAMLRLMSDSDSAEAAGIQ